MALTHFFGYRIFVMSTKDITNIHPHHMTTPYKPQALCPIPDEVIEAWQRRNIEETGSPRPFSDLKKEIVKEFSIYLEANGYPVTK